MDEVGSSINHSSSSPPTVKCVPFLFTDPTTNTTTPYSVFWPITKLEYLDAATCDWAVAFGIKDGGGGGADENVADIAAARNRSAYIHALGWLDNSAEEGEGVEEDDEKMAAAAALDFPKSSSAAFNLKTQLAQLVAFYMYHADRLNSSSSSTSPMSFTVEALDGDGQDRKIGLLTTLPFTTKNFMQVVKMRDLLGAEESSSSTTTTTSSVSDGGGSGLIVQCTALTESVKR